MSRFPIFKAPQLVQYLIVKSAEPSELFFLALCSKRAFHFVRYNLGSAIRNWNHVFICTGNYLEVHLNESKVVGVCARGGETNELCSLKFKTRVHKCHVKRDKDGKLDTVWEDLELGKQVIPSLVTEVFGLSIHTALTDESGLSALKLWNENQSSKIQGIAYLDKSGCVSADHLRSVLLDCPATRRLSVYAITPPNFQFNEPFPPFYMLKMLHAPWITVEQIMRMDQIEEIIIGKSTCTSTDLNRFLKHWLAGGSPKLRFLSMDIADRNASLFVGLERLTVYSNQYRQMVLNDGRRIYRIDGDSYDITRGDGARITIHTGTDNRGCDFLVWPRLE